MKQPFCFNQEQLWEQFIYVIGEQLLKHLKFSLIKHLMKNSFCSKRKQTLKNLKYYYWEQLREQFKCFFNFFFKQFGCSCRNSHDTCLTSAVPTRTAISTSSDRNRTVICRHD